MRNDYEDSYSSSGSAFLYFLGGLGLGALFMYLTDPDMGRRRRALLLDQYANAKRAVRDGTEAAVRDATNRVGGLIGKAQTRLDERQAQREEQGRATIPGAGDTPGLQ